MSYHIEVLISFSFLSTASASRPSGRAIAGKTKRKLDRQESKERTNRHEDAKQKLSIADKKQLFETHNKVIIYWNDFLFLSLCMCIGPKLRPVICNGSR